MRNVLTPSGRFGTRAEFAAYVERLNGTAKLRPDMKLAINRPLVYSRRQRNPLSASENVCAPLFQLFYC